MLGNAFYADVSHTFPARDTSFRITMLALLARAEVAQDAASALHNFLELCPDLSTEITALISELYAVSSALRGLSSTIVDLQHTGFYTRIAGEVLLTSDSIQHTFEDFNRLLGRLGQYLGQWHESAAYRRTWDDIDDFFYDQSNCVLRKRLLFYRNYLLQMVYVIEQG